jgi:large subunit ribosomal protein L21
MPINSQFSVSLAMPAAAADSASSMSHAGQLYAVVADSGRQFTVREGEELEVDFRHVAPGDEVVFDRVLAVSKDGTLKLGNPVVAGASVKAEVLGAKQGEKIYVQKFRRRKNYRRRTGHRELLTRVRVASIHVD